MGRQLAMFPAPRATPDDALSARLAAERKAQSERRRTRHRRVRVCPQCGAEVEA